MAEQSRPSRGGLPSLNSASTFEALKEIFASRRERLSPCDLARPMRDHNKPLRRLEEGWQPDAERLGDRYFPGKAEVNQRIPFREDREWGYERSGNPRNPVIRRVGYNSRRRGD